MFSHFHLLTQLVANALQAFAHRSVIHSGVRRESRGAPAAVVPPIAELPFFRRQRKQRVRQPNPLRLGPPRLCLVQDWNIRDLVQRQKRPPARPPHVERRCDDDATEPTGERGCILQVAKTPERAQVGLLNCILRCRRVLQHAERDGVHHRLRGVDQPAVRLDVPVLGGNDQISQSVHLRSRGTT